VLGRHFSPRPDTVGLAQPALAMRAVVRPAWLRRWPRCSTSGGDSTGERRQLCRASWGDGVLTGDGWLGWCGENDPTRRRTSGGRGRASMSPAAGGGDMGGEVRSKRDARRGCDGAHRGAGEEWCGSTKMARRWQSGWPARTRGRGKSGGGDGVLDARS
jgi:hypothetical protein